MIYLNIARHFTYTNISNDESIIPPHEGLKADLLLIYIDPAIKLTLKSYLSWKLTDRRATIRSVLKVVYFLRTVWGIFLNFHTQSDPKQGIKKFPNTFTYNSRTITNLTKLDFPLPCDQTLKSRIWQMLSKKCGTFWLLWTKSDICDGTRVVGKCLMNMLIPCFGTGCVWACQQNSPGNARFRSYNIIFTHVMHELVDVNCIHLLLLFLEKISHLMTFLMFYLLTYWWYTRFNKCIKWFRSIISWLTSNNNTEFMARKFELKNKL
jgi:hypothetical protein